MKPFLSLFYTLCAYLLPAMAATQVDAVLMVRSAQPSIHCSHCTVCLISDSVYCADCIDSGVCHFTGIKPGRYTLKAFAPGFDTLILTGFSIERALDSIVPLTLQPWRHLYELPVTKVWGRRNEAIDKSASVSVFSPEELMNVAGSANDLNRVLSINPGVTTNGTIEDNALAVRGGGIRENAYLVDGIELDNINHFSTLERTGGSLGFINTDLVQTLDFYSGGIPASMPSGVSSVIDIKVRQGSRDKRGGEIDLNLSGIGAVLEGGCFGQKATYLFNARWNDMRFLERFVTTGEIPRFGDGLAKVTLALSDRHSVEAIGIASYDYLNMHPVWDVYPDLKRYRKELSQGAAGISSRFSGSRIDNSLVLSFTSLDDEWFLGPDVSAFAAGVIVDSMGTREGRRLGTIREDFTLRLGTKLQLDAGANARIGRYATGHFDYYNDAGDTVVDGSQAGAYVQGSLICGFFAMHAGVRGDYYTMISDYGIAPRIGLVLMPQGWGEFSLNGGTVYQMPVPLTRHLWYFLLPYHRDIPFYIEDFKLQRCRYGGLGYEKALGKSHRIRADTYLKWYDREYPFITPWQSQYKDSNQVINGIWYWRMITPDGKKRSYGAELTVQKNTQSLFYYCGSVTLSSVQNRYMDGHWYHDRNDIEKAASLILGSNPGKHHRLSLRFSAAQGRPFIASTASADYYSERMNPLFLLNVRYGFDRQGNRTRYGAYVEILNVLNQTPIAYQEWDNDVKKFMNRRMNGILPNAGFTVAF